MFHQVDSREAVVFQILSRIIRFKFRSLIFFFRSRRFYFKPGFRLFQRFVLHSGNRVGNSRFKHHRHSFTFIRQRRLFRLRLVDREFIFRFFSLYIHYRCRRRCLFIRPFQIELHFLRLGSREFLIAFPFRDDFFFLFLFAF